MNQQVISTTDSHYYKFYLISDTLGLRRFLAIDITQDYLMPGYKNISLNLNSRKQLKNQYYVI